MTRLSALVVNYNSGGFAVCCVRSLQIEWEASGRRRQDLEIVVVDNASPQDQSHALSELQRLGARVVRSRENLGYAGGMNLAYRHTSGGPKDVVAILNPDLCFLAGSIDPLLEYLTANPDCGAVDPRAYIDTRRTLHMPRNLLPTPMEQVRVVLAQRGGVWARAYSRRRLRRNLEWWRAEGPVEGDMLSGCCVFLRREVVECMGGPMDGAYPLYFEDTDLFRTLRRLGYRTVHHGGSTVLHFWSRSSGVGAEFEGDPRAKFRRSMRIYYDKYYGRLVSRAVCALDAIGERWGRSPSTNTMHAFRPLGSVEEPPVFELDGERPFVFETTMAPTFGLALGVLGEGRSFRFHDHTWTWLFEGDYFARALDRHTGELLGAWSFQKTRPGRWHPPDEEEIRWLRGEGVPASSEIGEAAS